MMSGQDRSLYSNKEVEKKITEMKNRNYLQEKFGDQWKSGIWKRGVDELYQQMKSPEEEAEEIEEEIQSLKERKQKLEKISEREEALEEYQGKKEKLEDLREKLQKITDVTEDEKRQELRRKYIEGVSGEPSEEQVNSYVERKIEDWKEEREKRDKIQSKIGRLEKQVKEFEETYEFT